MSNAASSATSLAIAAVGGLGVGGGMLLPRLPTTWRSFFRHAADVMDDPRASDATPSAVRRAFQDNDYYETDGPESQAEALFTEQFVHMLGPYGAAFMAGWSLRGTTQAPSVRGACRTFIGAVAAAATSATAGRRRRRDRSSSQQSDLAALVAELRSGGDAARQAAAKELAAGNGQPARQGSKKGKTQ
jgi:hypothetical protein